jgi:hypothetical protein
VLEPDANCSNCSTREAGGVELRGGGKGVVSIGYGIRTLRSGGLEVVSRSGVASGATILGGGSRTDLGATVATVLFGGTETVRRHRPP